MKFSKHLSEFKINDVQSFISRLFDELFVFDAEQSVDT